MIRPARPEDAGRLAAIYAHYVENTAVTYVTAPPSEAAFRDYIEATQRRYPFLVLEADGDLRGYACAGPFVDHAAFSHCCTTTIYLAPDARRRGYGRLLYEAIEERLRAAGVTNLYACVGDPVDEADPYLSRDSERFHRSLGFAKVGTMHQCGRKFGRLYNMVWMEKII